MTEYPQGKFTITQLDLAILNILYEEEKGLSLKEIIKKLNNKFSKYAVIKSLKKLISLNLVEKVNSDKKPMYQLKEFIGIGFNGTIVLRTKGNIIVINCPYASNCSHRCLSPDCPFYQNYKFIFDILLGQLKLNKTFNKNTS